MSASTFAAGLQSNLDKLDSPPVKKSTGNSAQGRSVGRKKAFSLVHPVNIYVFDAFWNLRLKEKTGSASWRRYSQVLNSLQRFPLPLRLLEDAHFFERREILPEFDGTSRAARTCTKLTSDSASVFSYLEKELILQNLGKSSAEGIYPYSSGSDDSCGSCCSSAACRKSSSNCKIQNTKCRSACTDPSNTSSSRFRNGRDTDVTPSEGVVATNVLVKHFIEARRWQAERFALKLLNGRRVGVHKGKNKKETYPFYCDVMCSSDSCENSDLNKGDRNGFCVACSLKFLGSSNSRLGRALHTVKRPNSSSADGVSARVNNGSSRSIADVVCLNNMSSQEECSQVQCPTPFEKGKLLTHRTDSAYIIDAASSSILQRRGTCLDLFAGNIPEIVCTGRECSTQSSDKYKSRLDTTALVALRALYRMKAYEGNFVTVAELMRVCGKLFPQEKWQFSDFKPAFEALSRLHIIVKHKQPGFETFQDESLTDTRRLVSLQCGGSLDAPAAVCGDDAADGDLISASIITGRRGMTGSPAPTSLAAVMTTKESFLPNKELSAAAREVTPAKYSGYRPVVASQEDFIPEKTSFFDDSVVLPLDPTAACKFDPTTEVSSTAPKAGVHTVTPTGCQLVHKASASSTGVPTRTTKNTIFHNYGNREKTQKACERDLVAVPRLQQRLLEQSPLALISLSALGKAVSLTLLTSSPVNGGEPEEKLHLPCSEGLPSSSAESCYGAGECGVLAATPFSLTGGIRDRFFGSRIAADMRDPSERLKVGGVVAAAAATPEDDRWVGDPIRFCEEGGQADVNKASLVCEIDVCSCGDRCCSGVVGCCHQCELMKQLSRQVISTEQVMTNAKQQAVRRGLAAKSSRIAEETAVVCPSKNSDSVRATVVPRSSCAPISRSGGPSWKRVGANYSLRLILDTRERVKQHQGPAIMGVSDSSPFCEDDFLIKQLRRNGIHIELRPLPVGDALWVVRLKQDASSRLLQQHEQTVRMACDDTGPERSLLACLPRSLESDFPGAEDFVLPVILERKTLRDLSASFKDGRYEEQKYRLLRCPGITRVFYVVEGLLDCSDCDSVPLITVPRPPRPQRSPHSAGNSHTKQHSRFYSVAPLSRPLSTSAAAATAEISALRTAQVKTQILDGFSVLHTSSPAHTVAMITRLHRKFLQHFSREAVVLETGPSAAAPSSSSFAASVVEEVEATQYSHSSQMWNACRNGEVASGNGHQTDLRKTNNSENVSFDNRERLFLLPVESEHPKTASNSKGDDDGGGGCSRCWLLGGQDTGEPIELLRWSEWSSRSGKAAKLTVRDIFCRQLCALPSMGKRGATALTEAWDRPAFLARSLEKSLTDKQFREALAAARATGLGQKLSLPPKEHAQHRNCWRLRESEGHSTAEDLCLNESEQCSSSIHPQNESLTKKRKLSDTAQVPAPSSINSKALAFLRLLYQQQPPASAIAIICNSFLSTRQECSTAEEGTDRASVGSVGQDLRVLANA